jgi:hypothetical protein
MNTDEKSIIRYHPYSSVSFHFEAPETDWLAWGDTCLAGGDLNLLSRVVNAGNIWK